MRGDDYFTKIILNKFVIFRYIHPNAITIFGIMLNIAILFAAGHCKFCLMVILFVLRYFADCLDGGVARKYSKSSNIGGVLDTFSDNLLIFIYIIIMFRLLNFSGGILVATCFVVLNLCVMAYSNSLINHSGMKAGGNSFKNTYAFFINNSYILFITMIVTLYFGMFLSIDFQCGDKNSE